MNAPISVTYARLGDLLDPLLQLGLLATAALIVIARSLGPQLSAGPPDADLPCLANQIDELPPESRP
jgi:hypothetical protein